MCTQIICVYGVFVIKWKQRLCMPTMQTFYLIIYFSKKDIKTTPQLFNCNITDRESYHAAVD